MPQITISGKTFTYTVRRKSVRSLRLHLDSSSSFIISCPHLTPNLVISGFIEAHRAWIYESSQKIPHKKSMTELSRLDILSQPYQLFIAQTSKDFFIINPSDHKIYLYSSSLSDSQLKKVLEKHLRPWALSLINRELKQLASQYDFKFNRVSVRNQKTRFGSCSSRGNLNFNWQIIFFPYDKFRHVLLHELTHLQIPDHSRRFWDMLTFYDPNSKTNNAWLRRDGPKCFIL